MTGTIPDDEQHRFHRLLLQNVPEQFFRDWLSGLTRAYRDSKAAAYGQWKDPEAHDALGHVRRANIETLLCQTGAEHGLTCPAEATKMNNCYHRELYAGNVVVTQCYSDDRKPREAAFRDELSGEQGELLDAYASPVRTNTSDDPVHVILLHGAHPSDRSVLGYAEAYFPQADPDRHHTRLDLLAMFGVPATVAPAAVPEEEVASTVDIRPRKHAQQEGA